MQKKGGLKGKRERGKWIKEGKRDGWVKERREGRMGEGETLSILAPELIQLLGRPVTWIGGVPFYRVFPKR